MIKVDILCYRKRRKKLLLIHKFHKPFALGVEQIYAFVSSPDMTQMPRSGVNDLPDLIIFQLAAAGWGMIGQWGQKGDVISE